MSTTYTPEQITTALMALVATGGDVKAVAAELLEDEFQVPADTLRRWKNETYAERYQQLELRYAEELEQITVQRLRKNAERAAEVEAELLEEMTPEKVPPDQRAQALRAVADVKSKSVDKMLALTGRPTDGKRQPDMAEVLRSLASKGLVKVNVNLEPTAIEGTAEEVAEIPASGRDANR